MSNLIFVSDAAKKMAYKPRTFIKWAKKHSINIFSEKDTRKKYIIEDELVAVRAQCLKNQDGISLYEYLKSSMYVNTAESITREKENRVKSIKTEEEYKPVGKHEKAFYETLTQIINEL